MKNTLFKGKSKRTRIFTVITLVLIVALLAVNYLLTHVGLHKSVYVDMTPEGLYTLSSAMAEECAFVDKLDETDGDKKIKITFCADPDTLTDSTMTRVTYFMAIKLANRFKNIEVETVNVNLDPSAVSMYKATSLSTIQYSDIIVSYGDRYRISSADSFWTVDSDGSYFSYNGEYKMASILMSVTAVNQPAAYFLTDHGETYYDVNDPESEKSLKTAYLYDLLTERGLEVKTLDLSKADSIPEDCVLLVINNPTEDFTVDKDKLDRFDYISDTEKLDRYLVNGHGSIMVAKDYAVTLPVFETFLREWGFEFSTTQVKDETASLSNPEAPYTDIIGVYDTDENSYGSAIYGDFSGMSSAPQVIYSNTGYIKCAFGESNTMNETGTFNISKNYAPFMSTSDKAKAYAKNPLNGLYVDLAVEEGVKNLAAVSTRLELDTYTSEYKYSYLFCAASGEFFSNKLLGNASYANFDIVSALVNNMSRSDEYASIELGSTSLNSSSFGGKQLVSTVLSDTDTNVYSPDAKEIVRVNKGISKGEIGVFTTVVAIIPVAIAIVGIVICTKRRFL